MLKRLFVFDFTTIFRRVKRAVFAILAATLVSLGILLLSGIIPATASFATSLNNALTVIFYAVIIAFAALFAFCLSQIFIHFYQSFFGEEGAFTRTIPVSANTLLSAKLLSGGLWTVILFGIGAVAVLLGALLPIEMLMRAENVSFLTNFTRMLGDEIGAFTLPALLLSLLSKLVLCYFAVTLGALLFPRRGVFGAILLFVLFLAADILLHSLLSTLVTPIFEWDSGISASLPDIFSMLLSLVLGGASYLGTRRLFQGRLSLYY